MATQRTHLKAVKVKNESISVDNSKNYDGSDGDNDNESEEEGDQVISFASTLSTL